MISEVRKIYMQDRIIRICVTYPIRIRDITFQSLLVTRWNLLVAHYSLQKITRYSLQKQLVTCCKIHSLLVSEVARYKKSFVIHCTANFDRYLLCKVATKNQFQLNLDMGDKIYMNLALSIECFMKKKPYPATWQNFWLEIAHGSSHSRMLCKQLLRKS